MRKYFVSAFVLAALLAFATSGLALEKSASQFSGDTLGDWNAGGSSVSVSYYNICTGWIWVYSSLPGELEAGTVFDNCGNGVVQSTYMYFRTAAPANYGFTGTAAIETVDAQDCPTGALMSQPHLPAAGWNFFAWGVAAPARFAAVYTLADEQGLGNPTGLVSDGPNACGVCFPTTRTTNSYTWGLTSSPACPGSAMADNNCFVEWLGSATLTCPVSVEDESWGSIKTLYR